MTITGGDDPAPARGGNAAGAPAPRFDLDRRIVAPDRLFYVAKERLSS